MAFLWWVSGSVGIGFTYHRLLTHRGFKVPKWLEYVGTVCGMLMSEGGAITWVAMHRIHHAHSDKPGQDLHTPKDGFWWSHMGWILCRLDLSYREMEQRYAPEMVADPVHLALNRLHVLPNILLGFALFALGGWSWLIWGMFVRLVVGLNTTWFVNSATHTWGYRTFETNEDSRNLWWVGLLAWGEGWHNNHHAFQRSARHGLAWWEFDANWVLIRSLAAVGLVSDIQLLPKNAERFRIRKGESLPEAAAA
jgi:stearoyl-CoA desaturase (delta-9 desaturase)